MADPPAPVAERKFCWDTDPFHCIRPTTPREDLGFFVINILGNLAPIAQHAYNMTVHRSNLPHNVGLAGLFALPDDWSGGHYDDIRIPLYRTLLGMPRPDDRLSSDIAKDRIGNPLLVGILVGSVVMAGILNEGLVLAINLATPFFSPLSYTITAGLLAAAAVFLVGISSASAKEDRNLRQNVLGPSTRYDPPGIAQLAWWRL